MEDPKLEQEDTQVLVKSYLERNGYVIKKKQITKEGKLVKQNVGQWTKNQQNISQILEKTNELDGNKPHCFICFSYRNENDEGGELEGCDC